MDQLADRIKKEMVSEGRNRFPSLAFFLYLASRLYDGAARARAAVYRKGLARSRRLPAKVISIGNLTVGGTGKTPMTLYVGRLLRRLGYRVAVVSRGYKGSAEARGGIVSDGKSIRMGPEKAGDEPFMLACELEQVPVIVGRNRYASGLLAIETFGSNVIVLDDGFQHLQLARDLDLLLLDSRRPLGNSYLLPRGTLREPVAALSRADALVVTRWTPEHADGYARACQWAAGRPVFRSFHRPRLGQTIRDGVVRSDGLYDLKSLKHLRIFGFSGIARNQNFHDLLHRLECEVADFRGFEDHHLYSDSELEALLRAAQAYRCDAVLTTSKDFARISHRVNWPLDLLALGLETEFGNDRDGFDRFVAGRLGLNHRREVPGQG